MDSFYPCLGVVEGLGQVCFEILIEEKVANSVELERKTLGFAPL